VAGDATRRAGAEVLQTGETEGTLHDATTIRRKRRPSSRRTGQTGNVFQHCKSWNPTAPGYGRYWFEAPVAESERSTVALGVCATRSAARRKLREQIEVEGINTNQTFRSTTRPATTFRAKAAKWFQAVSTRHRKPVKRAMISGWQHSSDKWVHRILATYFSRT
jgi:hypothetical protein